MKLKLLLSLIAVLGVLAAGCGGPGYDKEDPPVENNQFESGGTAGQDNAGGSSKPEAGASDQ